MRYGSRVIRDREVHHNLIVAALKYLYFPVQFVQVFLNIYEINYVTFVVENEWMTWLQFAEDAAVVAPDSRSMQGLLNVF